MKHYLYSNCIDMKHMKAAYMTYGMEHDVSSAVIIDSEHAMGYAIPQHCMKLCNVVSNHVARHSFTPSHSIRLQHSTTYASHLHFWSAPLRCIRIYIYIYSLFYYIILYYCYYIIFTYSSRQPSSSATTSAASTSTWAAPSPWYYTYHLFSYYDYDNYYMIIVIIAIITIMILQLCSYDTYNCYIFVFSSKSVMIGTIIYDYAYYEMHTV